MNDFIIPSYLFVVDTNNYAGNFEREMCAYMTGIIGECEKGDNEAEIAEGEIVDDVRNKLDDLIMLVPDENGCSRPVTIYPSKDNMNEYNSLAISMSEKPSKKIIQLLKYRAQEYVMVKPGLEEWNKSRFENLKILGFRLVKFTVKESTVNV